MDRLGGQAEGVEGRKGERVVFTCNRRGNAIFCLSGADPLPSRWKTLVDFIYVYIFGPLVLRPGSELTDHTEYAFTVAFVSVGVVCQRNEQTRFVDITRRLDKLLPISFSLARRTLKTR